MFYTLSIGLSAFLLFLIEPLISKILLPWFGGGATIWLTSLVFFQTMLLIGYGFTHFVVRRLGLRKHMMITAALLVVSVVCLPVSVGHYAPSPLPPVLHLGLLLTTSVGLPYFVLSTASPTLQYWIAHDSRMSSRNPYVQYGVSNLGSLLGLLAYPFVLEPLVSDTPQRWLWSAMYLAYVGVMAMTIAHFVLYNRTRGFESPDLQLDLGRSLRLRWIFQAMVPAALLMVVTHYITLDVVNLPLLWVAPLCIYLISFIICFLFPAVSKPRNIRSLVGILAILGLLIANHDKFDFDFEVKLAASLACLFCVCMIFHGDLERGKPQKQDLTDFYLQIAAGGMLGSMLTTIVAPLVFKSLFEFYVVLVVAVYYIAASQLPMRRPVKAAFILAITASISVSYVKQETGLFGRSIYQARSFYSTYSVEQVNTPPPARRLIAGTHIHGVQLINKPWLPVAYYHSGTGVADIYRVLQPKWTALVGLGIGTIVDYGNASSHFDVYEIDPTVIRIAKHYFSILRHSQSHIRYYVGDGRIGLREHPSNKYDLIVMDAFSSGSIPTHLITEQAIEEYLEHLNLHGAIAYNISNRRLNLLPVLNAIAHKLNLWILYDDSTYDQKLREYPARWVVLTRDTGLVEKLRHDNFGWQSPPPRQVLWTDQFSNIWSVVRWD